MSLADEWKKENEERKKYMEANYDSDYWYEHLVVEEQLFPSHNYEPRYIY